MEQNIKLVHLKEKKDILEDKMYSKYKEKFKVSGKDLLKKIESIIREGNVNRIVVKNTDGNMYMELPVSIGIIGAVFAPMLTAVVALAGLAANFSVEIIRREDTGITEVQIIEVKEDK